MIKYPKAPHSRQISGWYVDGPARTLREEIARGECTSKGLKRLVKYLRQLIRWVEQEEERLRRRRR